MGKTRVLKRRSPGWLEQLGDKAVAAVLRRILLFGNWYRLRSKDLMYQYHRPTIDLCRDGMCRSSRSRLLSQSATDNKSS